jgi:hypothetical protein
MSFFKHFVLLLISVTLLTANEFDNQIKIKGIEQNLETQVTQELKLFINRPITARVSIKTEQVRSKKTGVQRLKNSLALPGIYDIDEEVSFDEVTNEFYVVKTQIAQIAVHIDIDEKASPAEMQLAVKIAEEKAKLNRQRGDSVTINKKAFASKVVTKTATQAKKDPAILKELLRLQKELQALKSDTNRSFVTTLKDHDSDIKDLNSSYAKRLSQLEIESKKRLAKLDKNDIDLLSKLDKDDIKRIENLISGDKKRLEALSKKVDDAIKNLPQLMQAKLQEHIKVYDEHHKYMKQKLAALKNSLATKKEKPVVVTNNNSDEAIDTLRTQTKAVIDKLLIDINSNFALLQAQIRSKESDMRKNIEAARPLKSSATDSKELALLKEQFSDEIIKLRQDLEDEKDSTQTWFILLIIAMLSLGYILYYFNSNSNERIEEELEDSMLSITNALQHKRKY